MSKVQKKKSLHKAIHRLMATTSFEKVTKPTNITLQITGAVLFFVLFTLAICLLYLLSREFLKFDVATTFRHERRSELQFPAVTFCNLQYLNTKSEELSPDLRQLLADYASTEFISQSLETHPEPLKSFSAASEKYLKSLIEDDIIRVGFKIDEMLLGCFFMGINCFSYDFKEVLNEKYGKCYIFNADKLRKKLSLIQKFNLDFFNDLTFIIQLRIAELIMDFSWN